LFLACLPSASCLGDAARCGVLRDVVVAVLGPRKTSWDAAGLGSLAFSGSGKNAPSQFQATPHFCCRLAPIPDWLPCVFAIIRWICTNRWQQTAAIGVSTSLPPHTVDPHSPAIRYNHPPPPTPTPTPLLSKLARVFSKYPCTLLLPHAR
jgi:hypothetical protein